MHPQNRGMLRRFNSSRSMRSVNSEMLDDCSSVNDWEIPAGSSSSNASQQRIESSISRRLNDVKSHSDRRSALSRTSSRTSRSSRHAASSSRSMASSSRSMGHSGSRRKGLARTPSRSQRSQSSMEDRFNDLTIGSAPLDPAEQLLMEMFEKEEHQHVDHRSLLKPRKVDPQKIKKAYRAVMADQDDGDKKMPFIDRHEFGSKREGEGKKKRRARVGESDPAASTYESQDEWGEESIQFLDASRNSSPPPVRKPTPPEVPRQRSPPPQPTPTMVEVVPGFELPLRGSSETQHAISQGRIAKVNCMECTLELKCIDSAEFILCPLCHAISPLECSVNTLHDSFGVGLGFIPEDNM